MRRDFMKNLPSEISIDILSRLPIPTIMCCKCVCKSWLYLLESHEFVMTHISKSVPGLAVRCSDEDYGSDYSDGSDFSGCPDLSFCKVFEFVDGLDLEHHELHYNLLSKFEIHYRGSIQGSVHGLLFVRDLSSEANDLFIYNPITRDYIVLECPQDFVNKFATFGFGVSKVSGQYKVVGISLDYIKDEKTEKGVRFPRTLCHVYTLGTRLWRIVELNVQLTYDVCTVGAIFLNGNLHWLVHDMNNSTSISCFDLETEIFSIFYVPPPPRHEEFQRALSALEDCLCLCDNSSEGELVIWLMKEYGDEKSWTREFIIKKYSHDLDDFFLPVYPVKVFEDGDILIGSVFYRPIYYSVKTKTVNDIRVPEMCSLGCTDAILHTSSFLSLKSFPMEYVCSL